jgi:heme O synthase-like polyprenyltransferase
MSAYGLWWFWQMLKGRAAKDKSTWAKHVFLWSLIALPLMSILLILNNWLP